MGIGTKSKFVIYDKRTHRVSKFSVTSSAYTRTSRKDRHFGVYTKRRRTGPVNIQFPMLRNESNLAKMNFRTPGIRKALKALARARKANVNRIAAGKKPKIGGKIVSLSKFNKATGAKMTKKKAQRIKKGR